MNQLILDGHKLAWHKERVQQWLVGEHVAPITIDCALTQRCSYNCVYCFSQVQKNNTHSPLIWQHARDFADDCAEIGVKGISLVSDGESTLAPFCCAFINRVKENGMDIALATNGYYARVNNEVMVRNLTYLRFNFSAATPRRYSKVMGCSKRCYGRVIGNIRECVELKHTLGSNISIGMQMVLMPKYNAADIIPLTILAKDLGVDYIVIKHCTDNEKGEIGVDYDSYENMTNMLKAAEGYTDEHFYVGVKWSKILSGGKRCYKQCYAPPLMLQLSGSGLIAPCGSFFRPEYAKYHIGWLQERRFKDIFKSDRYWQVMDLLASEQFDAQTMCATLCLQHKVNEYLWDVKHGGDILESQEPQPWGVNFI